MKAQVKVGRIAGISIGLHYSWFIIALLLPSIAFSQKSSALINKALDEIYAGCQCTSVN